MNFWLFKFNLKFPGGINLKSHFRGFPHLFFKLKKKHATAEVMERYVSLIFVLFLGGAPEGGGGVLKEITMF